MIPNLANSKINLNIVIEQTFCPELKGEPRVEEEYIQAITELLKDCNDISLLDLIYQLLKKHSTQF